MRQLLIILAATAALSCSRVDLRPSADESDEGVGVQRAAFSARGTPVNCVVLRRAPGIEVADAVVRSTALRQNFGAQPILRVSARDESLLRFDLSSIPAKAAVTRATLKLYVNGDSSEGTTEVHRILTPWREDTVTFHSFQQRFAPPAAATFRITSKTALKSVDITPLVASWVGLAHPNHGLLLSAGDDHRPDCGDRRDEDRDPTVFVSSDASNAGKRPRLEVCFTSTHDYCAPSPCQHGGTCVNGETSYACECPAGFTGRDCETEIDECAGHPCQNSGNCVDRAAGYTCQCVPGFTGPNCEVNIDDCSPDPCLNGGVCTDEIGAHTCACPPGYEGSNCESLIDNCVSAPCSNGGTCVTQVGGYTCQCAPGFSGPNCDTNVDDCTPTACQNGSCVDGINGYTCSCAPDFGGAHCELNLNSCGQKPCLNGGTCANQGGSYVCACSTGYAGANCEIDIDDCASDPCLNGGVCVDGLGRYACECPPGFAGPQCELVCNPQTEGQGTELCDGKDNDCDGAIDEDFALKGSACAEDGRFDAPFKLGACRGTGTLICNETGSGLSCNVQVPGAQPHAELCNGLDDDCDAHVDEPYDSDGFAGVRDDVVGPFVVSGVPIVVFRYEASTPLATATSVGSPTGRACSAPGRLPWSMVSYDEARAACAAGGMRLCATTRDAQGHVTSSEWGRACEGAANLAYPYAGAYRESACNGSDLDPVLGAPNEDLALPTGSLETCQSPDHAFDLSGNLREWTEDPRIIAAAQRYTVRGGSFDAHGPALTCDADSRAFDPSYRSPNVGFRCCAQACAAGRSACNGTCVDMATSNTNCGACGHACEAGRSCSNGYCCPTGQHACGNVCVPNATRCF